MRDRLSIRGLKASTVIGVRDWERQLRQPVVIDLELAIDAAVPSATDDLGDALDYGAVARRVTALVEASSYRLIETLAEELATTLLTEFPTVRVTVRVTKPSAVLHAEAVSVEIERGSAPSG